MLILYILNITQMNIVFLDGSGGVSLVCEWAWWGADDSRFINLETPTTQLFGKKLFSEKPVQ